MLSPDRCSVVDKTATTEPPTACPWLLSVWVVVVVSDDVSSRLNEPVRLLPVLVAVFEAEPVSVKLIDCVWLTSLSVCVELDVSVVLADPFSLNGPLN
jgi:hypothetical protein